MGLSRSDLELLMASFEASEWTEMVLSMDGTRVELTSTGRPPVATDASTGAAQPAAAGAPPAAASVATSPAAAATPADGADGAAPHQRGDHEVLAPSVGIFYRAPAPDAPPFVHEGAHVAADDIVCIVEVMKLMNHVKAGASGVVRSIHVDDATMIEHGQLLFTIDTSA